MGEFSSATCVRSSKHTKRHTGAGKSDETIVKVITIDGPAGSGKSTVAQQVAQFLGWTYVTTGAIYRTLAWMLFSKGRDENDSVTVEECVAILNEKYRQDTRTGRVFLGDEELTDVIRTPEASERASLVARNEFVRQSLLPVQRRVVISCNGAVVDGRDMGTVVFPESPLKVFLTAAPEERAKRRAMELRSKGQEVDIVSLVKEIHERDERDANRAVAPMRPAEDALLIDCTQLTPQQVADVILRRAAERGLVETSGTPL